MIQRILVFVVLLLSVGCFGPKKNIDSTVSNSNSEKNKAHSRQAIYKGTPSTFNKMVHVKLELKPDWEKEEMPGKATLTLEPYFLPVTKLVLDAKGMEIREVAIIDSLNSSQKVVWKHENNKLNITLDKEYKRGDQYKVFVDYVARPNVYESQFKTSAEQDKGLYFINPKGQNKNKFKHLWTQGETEFNSVWFPVIDDPSQKITQEIAITVDDKMTTLSNGRLTFSTDNGDGTKTDYWSQDKPHAPYLAMIAVGDFFVSKDQWNDIEVSYYVPPADSAYIQDVFGNTPEMMTFYSNLLGVEYPWEKYSQVIVSEYTSGAMENTSAVVHADWVFRSDRELLDTDYEFIIAHELFHHWFGNLVTCENWANLPLNESFANYGEYLWIEYKYGKDLADEHLNSYLESYLVESSMKKEDLIRFDYENTDDLFDAHSYDKGGRILHMLRIELGDEVFFAGLKHYLETNKYSTAEVHNLRMSMEAISGQDLNWFFNQWFLAKGHPELDIQYNYLLASDSLQIIVKQKQDLETTPLYILPATVEIFDLGKSKREKIVIQNEIDTFSFAVNDRPEVVIFDPEKELLYKSVENKTPEEWAVQFRKSKNVIAREEALMRILYVADTAYLELKTDIVLEALSDDFHHVREIAVQHLDLISIPFNEIFDIIEKVAFNDKKAKVRGRAVRYLCEQAELEEIEKLLSKSLQDSSYYVLAQTIYGIYLKDKERGLQLMKDHESEMARPVLYMIARAYAKQSDKKYFEFFEQKLSELESDRQADMVLIFARYLKNQDEKRFKKGAVILEELARSDDDVVVRKNAVLALNKLKVFYSKQIEDITADIADQKSAGKKNYDEKIMTEKKKQLEADLKVLEETIQKICAAEKNTQLIAFYKEKGFISAD